jgi:CRP-like cAMP-binding protein
LIQVKSWQNLPQWDGIQVESILVRQLLMRDSSLPLASRRLLISMFRPQKFVAAGTMIVNAGDRPDHCTLIVSGWACRFSTLSDGRRQTLALHLSGDFVDLHSFPIKVMDHGVRALTDCSVATVPHSQVRRVTETDPHLTRTLWLLTLVDAAILRQWLLSTSQRTALEHTAHLLCELFIRLQAVGLATPGRSFELPISQLELANALGISSVHLSRMMGQLRTRKLFVWRSSEAEILDWTGLKLLAQFDPTYLLLQDEPR